MATVDVKLDDKTELTLPANENDYIYILRQVAGGGFSITDYKIKVRNLIGDALPFTDDLSVPNPTEGTQYFNSTTKQMRGYDGAVWRNMYNNVFNTKTTLTASQIKDIGTTPIQLIPAQGVGTIISPISVIARLNWNTTAFTANGLDFYLDSTHPLYIIANIISRTEDTIIKEAEWDSNNNNLVENSPFMVGGTDSAITGDSTLDIYVSYQIITL